MSKKVTIADITHPRYDLRYREWMKWRLTYRSGRHFIEQYLKPYSKREDPNDFEIRKTLTYCPAFAKAAVDEVKNSIYQRMADISRTDGSENYRRACAGLDNGVDLLGSTMTSFVGQSVLPELLTMSKVGIYVDMPTVSKDDTLLAQGDKRPYLYLYEAEDIRSWTYDDSASPNEFGSLLLRDYVYEYDEDTGLPTGQTSRFRHFWIENGQVMVQFYNKEGEQIGYRDPSETEPIALGIKRIPFVIFELNDSLLSDIADYQIALLNLASSDVNYTLKSNFPFYTEQFEPKAENMYLRPAGPDTYDPQTGTQIGKPGTVNDSQSAKPQDVKLGASAGRRYPVNTERPGFIHPSSEPLQASMKKQEQMKEEMRLLLNLAITNMQARATSAESKGLDERSLEAGLSAIGLTLEAGERLIASYWSMYEKKESATVKYPEKYNLKSDDDRRKEASETAKLTTSVPSRTFAKEMAKRITGIMIGNRISEVKLQGIFKEIDEASGLNSEPDAIAKDVELGLVDLETASELRGYPKGTVEKAKQDHADRLARIAESQSSINPNSNGSDPGARGITDASANPADPGSAEKTKSRDTTGKDIPTSGIRGKGKKNGAV